MRSSRVALTMLERGFQPDASPYAIRSSKNPIPTLISNGLGRLGRIIEAAGSS